MPTQTMTVTIPEAIYHQLERRAQETNRSVETELVEALAAAIPTLHDLADDWGEVVSSLSVLDDHDLWRIARGRLDTEAAEQLEALHWKRQREDLTAEEAQSLSDLVRKYERAMLARARAASLLRERGHDVNDLITGR
jgi:hypothetical protein